MNNPKRLDSHGFPTKRVPVEPSPRLELESAREEIKRLTVIIREQEKTIELLKAKNG